MFLNQEQGGCEGGHIMAASAVQGGFVSCTFARCTVAVTCGGVVIASPLHHHSPQLNVNVTAATSVFDGLAALSPLPLVI